MLAPRTVVEAGVSVSTALPFLYQTKTLRSRRFNGAGVVCRHRCWPAISRRQFSCIGRVRSADENNASAAPGLGRPAHSSNNASSPDTLGKTPLSKVFEAQRVETAKDLDFWFPEERGKRPGNSRSGHGYKGEKPVHAKRFGAESSSSKGFTLPTKPSYASLSRRTIENEFDVDDSPIQFDQDAKADDIFLGKDEDEIQSLSLKPESPESTITEGERAAFQKIFMDLFQRSKRSSTGGIGSLKPSDFLGPTKDHNKTPSISISNGVNIKPVIEARQEAKLKLNNIIASALETNVVTREKMEEVIKRYPPPLRAAAAKAMGYVPDENEAEEGRPIEGLVATEELEALREPERARVEALMSAAESDFELMDIMEKEVFSLIQKLGLDDGTQPRVKPTHEELPGKPQRVKGWKKAERRAQREQKESAPNARETPIVEPPDLAELSVPTLQSPAKGVSPLEYYAPLYPSYLLFGLRLLDRSFSKSSALALTILPRIKSLGIISQVLGASTQLYNELLRIYHFRYDDFRGMIGLLQEMEDAAVDFDYDTYKIVSNVARIQTMILRGEKGAALQTLWKMPEFERYRIRDWAEKIMEARDDQKERPMF